MAEFFLQYKGTNICLDFYCECDPEEPRHFDGYFANALECDNCGRKYDLPYMIQALPFTGQHRPVLTVSEACGSSSTGETE